MAAWKLPLVVLAIAVPIALAFLLGGPAAGVAVGALVAVAIIFVAVRQRPRGQLGQERSALARERLLIVACCPLEEPATIAAIAADAHVGDPGAAEVMVLAPARIGFLDRWASDLEGARRDAQRNLVLTVAALAKTGIEAEARVGDEDVVQAVEDQLGSFDATEVVLVGAAGEEAVADAAAEELSRRLRPAFRRLTVTAPTAR